MVPERKSSARGSRGNNRNRRMGRGGSFRRGPLEKIKRNKPRARIFKRSDSEDSDRKESFDRSSKDKSDNYGGHDFYKKRPRPGPKPKQGAWGGQSRKSYEKHEKKFWREPPKAMKNVRPSPDKVGDSESGSEGEFGERGGRNFDHDKISRRKNKKRLGGGKKKKGRKGDDGYTSPDPTQSELEKAYASFEENEELIYERAKIGMSKRLTDKEMMLEIRKRDKEQYIADRNRAKKGVTVVKEEEYKSSDLESYTEMSSEFDSDSDFRESDYDHSSEGSDKDENKDHFISEEITKKLPKTPSDKKKISSNKAQVSETEWNDFLEKQVYDKEKDGKEKDGKEENKEVINGRNNISDLEDENEKQKAAQINTHLEAEYAKKRLSTLKNQWNWYHNLIKDITDGHLVLPKELPAEVDEEEEETNEINMKEIKHSDDEIKISEDELFLSDEESTHSNPDPYQESLKYFKKIQPSQPSEINETKPPATISEIEPELIPSQISPVDTKLSSPQPSEAKTAPQSLQPLEENKNEQTTTSVTNDNILNTLNEDKDEDEDDDKEDVVDTSNNEFLQNEWRIFLEAFEQCTGIVPDLPDELPDEADEETESTQSSDEVGDKIEIDDESQPVASLAEPIEPSDSSVFPEELINIHSGQDDETSQEEDSPAFYNVGFNKFLQRKEKQHDDDMNKCMYEMYKISGTEKEFKEEHPELFNSESNSKAETKAAIKWHHFKELWNRFVDVATADPSRAFKEYDKIVAAKEKAVREGLDVAELLKLKSVPEKEEPKTEYEINEQKIKAHWRKLMKNLKDPQEGLNEHLLQETDNKPDDDISKEAEETLRAVLSMCDHPERFDMDKYEASLSKEEKDSLMRGEGMKYDKRHNPNAANEIENASGTSIREGIAQKMWEYFVSLMRKRHELELEKFLADQPQNVIGDKPDQIKDLWQKYITHSTKTQELAPGTGEYNEGMDLLWAPEKRSRRYRPLPEDEDTSVQAKTQNGWKKLQEDLHTIQMGTYPGKEPSSLAGNEVTSGWSDLKEEMEKLSTYDKKPMQAITPPPKMEFSQFPDKNRLDYYYKKQFPEDKAIQYLNSQSYYKPYRNQQIDRPRDQTEYHRVHRTISYDRNTNPQNLGGYRNGQIKQSQSWQYGPEVDQITTIPFGPSRQSTPYDRNQEYNTRISSQSRWQMSSRESEENENVGGSSRVPLRRNNLPPLQPPGYNPPPLPDPPFMRQGLDTPYYTVKEDRHWPQSDKSYMEPQEQTKSIKNWQSGTRPFHQMQKELWPTQRLDSVNYNPNRIGPQYNQSDDYYGVGTQGEDCIHLMDPKKPQNSYQQRKFEGQPRYNVQQGTNGFPSERDSGMQPFESNTNR